MCFQAYILLLMSCVVGLLGQPGDQDLVCHLILVQSSFGIYESSCQNAQEAHNLGAINAFLHCTYFFVILIVLFFVKNNLTYGRVEWVYVS